MQQAMKALLALLVLQALVFAQAVCPAPTLVPVAIAQDFTGCIACPSVIAPLLAVHEVNTLQRRTMASEVDKLIDSNGCPLVQLQAQLLDTKSDALHTLRTAMASHLQDGQSVAIIGGTSSEVLYPLAASASASGVLTVTDSSTATSLGRSPAFSHVARLSANDDHLSAAIVGMMKHYAWSAIGLITVEDVYGDSVTGALLTDFAEADMTIVASGSFMRGDRAGMKAALQAVKATSVLVIVVTLYDSDAELFFDVVAELGMLGRTFVLTDAIDNPLATAANPTQLSQRMQGVLAVQSAVHSLRAFTDTQQAFPLQWSYLSATSAGDVGALVVAQGLSPFFFLGTALQLTKDTSVAKCYDAVWAVAVAAAAAARHNEGNVTGQLMYKQMANSSFYLEGASGPVRFTAKGERVVDEGALFPVFNMVNGEWVAVAIGRGSYYQGITAVAWPTPSATTPSDGVTCPTAYVYAAEHGRCIPAVGCAVRLPTLPLWPVEHTDHQYLAATLAIFHMINTRNSTLLPIIDALTLPVKPVLVDRARHIVEFSINVIDTVLQGSDIIALGGAMTSDDTSGLTSVISALRLPTIAAKSTSSMQVNKILSPTLVRNVVSDVVNAEALVAYMYAAGFRTLAMIGVMDLNSAVYASDVARFADEIGIKITDFSTYVDFAPETIVQAVHSLKTSTRNPSDKKVFLLISNGRKIDLIIDTLKSVGLMGRGFAWFTTSALSPAAYISYPDRPDMALDLQGFIRVVPKTPQPQREALDKLKRWWKQQDATSEHWIGLQDAAGVPPEARLPATTFEGHLDAFVPMVMDSYIHIALAERLLQETPEAANTPENRVGALRLVEFHGFSGYVKLLGVDELNVPVYDRDPSTQEVVVECFMYDNATGELYAEEVATISNGTLEHIRAPVWPGFLESTPNDGSGCEEGWYVDQASLQCTPCEPGYHFNTDEYTCEACTPGTFAPTPGLTQCVACASIQGYASEFAATRCNSCPLNTQHQPGSAGINVTDCVCMRGTFHPDGRAGEACLPCPHGAVCDGGAAPPVPIVGFWRFGPKHVTFLPCPGEAACQGVPVEAAATGSANASSYQTGCAEGYRGKFCASCDEGFGRSAKHTCTFCKDNPWLLALFLLVVVVIVIVLLYLIIKTIAQYGKVQAAGVLRKIFISHAQVMGILLNVELEWPGPVKSLFEVQNLVGSPANEEWVVADCQMPSSNDSSRFLRSQIIFAAAPLAIGLGVICLVFVWIRFRKTCQSKLRRQPSSLDTTASVLSTRDYIILSLVIIAYTMHPFLTRRALLMFSCLRFESYTREGGKLSMTQFWLNTEDFEISCSSGQWTAAQLLLGGPMVLLFVIGVPLVLFQQLRKHAWLAPRLSARARVVFGFLFLGFKKKYYYWEITTMSRKAVLGAIAVFMRGRAQLISVGLLLTLSLVAQMAASPYQNRQLDHVETVSLAVQTLNMLFGQFFFQGVLVQEITRISATGMLLALNVLFLVWMAWISFIAIKKDKKRKGQHVSAYSTRDINVLSRKDLAFFSTAKSSRSSISTTWSAGGTNDSSVVLPTAEQMQSCCCCCRRRARPSTPVVVAHRAIGNMHHPDRPVFQLALGSNTTPMGSGTPVRLVSHSTIGLSPSAFATPTGSDDEPEELAAVDLANDSNSVPSPALSHFGSDPSLPGSARDFRISLSETKSGSPPPAGSASTPGTARSSFALKLGASATRSARNSTVDAPRSARSSAVLKLGASATRSARNSAAGLRSARSSNSGFNHHHRVSVGSVRNL